LDRKNVNEIFDRFNQLRVLIIGDVMVDTYMWGKVERVSPEAPIPVISVTKRESRLGGAANVSLNIQALGAKPILFSVIGNDEKGKIFRELLEKRNISCGGIFIDRQRSTTVKNRIISSGQHVARVDEESTEQISKELENKIIEAASNEIENKNVDVVIFVDYDKGLLTPRVFESINTLAIKQGIPTSVDPKRKNFNSYKNASLFKPNFKEFTEGIGLVIAKGDLKGLKMMAHDFKERQNHKIIFVTLSELGVFISNGIQDDYFPAVIRDIADVSGAGDTVIAVASLAMTAGLTPDIMARMSNLAGGLVCEKLGVVPVDSSRLKEELCL